MGSWQPLGATDPTACGGFRLTHRLGEGGFGAVYLAYRADVAGPAAVKIFKSDYAADSAWRQRFRREIEAIRLMAGIHTAALIAEGGSDDPLWLATRYVHAPSLDKLIEKYGPFDQLGAWWLAGALSEALIEIHAKGILHRDLKPQNIMVEEAGLRVIDFGISRLASASSVTTSEKFFGTAAYAAMEHLEDPRRATEKSDIFALGAVLGYATTGQSPYGEFSYSKRLRFNPPPKLDGVPDQLVDLVHHCLQDEPQQRPTASEVLTLALDQLANYGVPLVSQSGIPLPAEIRDFVEAWAEEPIPAPTLITTGAGRTPDRTPDSSGISPRPGTDRPSVPKAGFDTSWRRRWNDGLDKRRRQYGSEKDSGSDSRPQ